MLILLNGERLEAALPQVAAGVIVPMITSHLRRQESLHDAAEVAILPGQSAR